MAGISSVRISVPAKTTDEIIRSELVSSIINSPKRLTYIHAGAGYGKTTLLAQVSASVESAVWLTLDGESDIFSFLGLLSEAIHHTFPSYEFNFSQYLPYEGRRNFINMLANALISSIENITRGCMIILDDLHTIQDENIKNFITCVIKYKPDSIRMCLGSREAPWQELAPLQIRGNILEIAQDDIVFRKDEATQILGFENDHIYSLTEGWPLGIISFKVLCENGMDPYDISVNGSDILDNYLFYECIRCLTDEMADFLKASACFEELDPAMLDAVTGNKNSLLILNSLVKRNIFTIKTKGDQFRHHTLFRNYLLKSVSPEYQKQLEHKAALYYYKQKQYSKAAKYAMLANEKSLLEKIILECYEDYINNGNFSELRSWFSALDDTPEASGPRISLVRGIFLSSIGNFSEARVWLDNVKPKKDLMGKDLYFDAIVHKARIIRNSVSFEESNRLLDNLLSEFENLEPLRLYKAGIEKIYNLCWDSKISEAYDTAYRMIETCARCGDLRIKAWFERYLTAIHFFAGRMKDAIECYEKSLELPEHEHRYLDMYSVGIYAAKAYQLLGDRNKAEKIITEEIQKLRSTGRYEELWAAYLLAAEIYFHIADMDRRSGCSYTYNTANKYFALGMEYASLYRTSRFQLAWAQSQRLVYSLLLTSGPKEAIIEEILSNLDSLGVYMKTIVLGGLFGYYLSVSDFQNAAKYARMSIDIGERSCIMMIPTIAYGILARAAIMAGEHKSAYDLTTRFLRLCSENGIYDYFKIPELYGSILNFAMENGIETDFVGQMRVMSGCKTKKIYVSTFGGLNIYQYDDRQKPVKMLIRLPAIF